MNILLICLYSLFLLYLLTKTIEEFTNSAPTTDFSGNYYDPKDPKDDKKNQ